MMLSAGLAADLAWYASEIGHVMKPYPVLRTVRTAQVADRSAA